MKKTKVAFKQVIPPIFIMTCLVMVLAYQNCGPQKMLVTKVNGLSSLCDTDPSRPECPQNFGQPTPTPPPIDPGTFGTCNPESLGWCVKYYNNTTQTGAPAAQYPLPRQDPPAHPGVEFSAHYVNGIPGANPLGVTANDWSMSAEVRWYPIAYSTLRFTIEYTGTVTYTFSAMSANGSTVTNTTTIESGTSVPANCTSAASCSYEIKTPDIAVSQPTGADFYLLKVVWSHSGTAPAHLRIVTPAAPGSTPTPTPTGSPGGATPTPTPPPNPISGRLLWNVSYIDFPPAPVTPSCPYGLTEVGAVHGGSITDSKFNSVYQGWLSFCAPSFNDAKILVNVVGSNVAPSCGTGFDRLFSAQMSSSSGLTVVRGLDANSGNTLVSRSGNNIYYSVCVATALNTPSRIMVPTPSTTNNYEVGCSPGTFLAVAFDLTTQNNVVAAKKYANPFDINGTALPINSTRIGFCLREDVTTIPELSGAVTTSPVTGVPNVNRKVSWPAFTDPNIRAKLDMKVVSFEEGFVSSTFETASPTANYANFSAEQCVNYKFYVVSCYNASAAPLVGCRISNNTITLHLGGVQQCNCGNLTGSALLQCIQGSGM